jgi:hypothetical protein
MRSSIFLSCAVISAFAFAYLYDHCAEKSAMQFAPFVVGTVVFLSLMMSAGISWSYK